jgi:hypothetical protein
VAALAPSRIAPAAGRSLASFSQFAPIFANSSQFPPIGRQFHASFSQSSPDRANFRQSKPIPGANESPQVFDFVIAIVAIRPFVSCDIISSALRSLTSNRDPSA